MGSASTLKWAGPSVLLAYIIAGLFVFFIMRSMGEMLFLEPVAGSFAVYAHKYMNPYFGYLTARGYWFYVDCRRHFGDHRHRGVCAVLVPGNTAVGAGADRRGNGGAGQRRRCACMGNWSSGSP